jgi:hypothetical protein
MVKDATAAYSEEMMHTAFDINMPNYANVIVNTDEFLQSVAAKQDEDFVVSLPSSGAQD